MPWTEPRPNGTHRAVWRDAAGKKHSKAGFTRAAEAMRYAGQQEGKAKVGGAALLTGRAPTWSEWCDRWLEVRRVEPNSARGDALRIERYLRPKWGHVRLNAVTRTDVQKWVNDLSKEKARGRETTLSPATVALVYHLFSASMKAATLDEGIPLDMNPCRAITLPTVAPGHERYLSREEVDAIGFHLIQPYQDAWFALVGTGMRFGELAGLHWQRVDLKAGTIDIVETWDSADGSIKPYTKSTARRTVPIPSWVRPILEARAELEHPKTCGQTHRAGGARCRSGLVFPSPKGMPLDAHNVGNRPFRAAVKLAGLDGVRLHDARHTYASWLVQAGVSLQEVQRLLGHADLTTTQRYAHLGTSQHAAIIAALG